MAMKNYKTYLDEKDNRSLEGLCKKFGMSKSQATRMIIRLYFLEHKPQYYLDEESRMAKLIMRQLIGLGTNLNQIAHGVNILVNADKMTKEEVANLQQVLTAIYKMIPEYQTVINEFTRRLL